MAYKVERLTLVSDAGQRCEVDALTYAVIKPGEVFHCNWGGTQPAEKSVTTEAPKTTGDPSGPDSASPWWWPFKKGASPTKAGKSIKKAS